MKKVILSLVLWVLITPIVFTVNYAANPHEIIAGLFEVEASELLYEAVPGYEGKDPTLFVIRRQTGDEYYLRFRENINNLYSPGCQGLIDALGVAIEDAIEINKPEDILRVPEGGTVNDLIFYINCYTGKPINLRMREIFMSGFDQAEYELDSTKARFRGIDSVARHNDTSVELFKVEDLISNPVYPEEKYFLTISESKGYKILCPSGAIQRGLGYWDPESVQTLDSEDDIVKSSKADEQPELLCEGAPGYDKKPVLFVVRSQAGDEYFLWYKKNINNLYSPGCQGLIDALGIAIEDAIEIDKPEDILIVPEGGTVNDLIFNINCYYGEPISISPEGIDIAVTYGGSDDDYAYSIQETSDEGYVVAGFTESYGTGNVDVWVLKLNSNDTVAWQNTYGGIYNDYAYSIQETSDGGYVVAGFTESYGAGSYDIWVLKLNNNGTVAWENTYGGSDSDYAYSIQETSDGGYVVTGYTRSYGAGGYDVWVLKLNSNGTVEWQNTYGGIYSNFARSIQETSDGGYVVAGFTYSYSAGSYDIWVLKLTSNGTVAWQNTYGGIYNDFAYSVQETSDGGYVVAGFTSSYGAGYRDIWVLKLTSNGTVAWQNTYGGIYNDFAYSIQETSDGGYVVAGFTESYGAGGYDVWVLKLDSDGQIGIYRLVDVSNAVGNKTTATPRNTSVSTITSSAIFADSSAITLNTWATVTNVNDLSLEDIYQEGKEEGARAFGSAKRCECSLEPPPIQNKYPADPEANLFYNTAYSEGFINAKAEHIVSTFSCKQECIEEFIEEGREAFRNESPDCSDLPIPKEIIYKFPHEGLNNLYKENYKIGFELEKTEFESTCN